MQNTEVVVGLVGHEAAQGAQVGAEGELAGGLDAGEDAGPWGAIVGGEGPGTRHWFQKPHRCD